MATVVIAERLAGLDPRQFWQAPAPRACWSAMADKYAALLAPAMTATADSAAHRQALRESARRWPGSLREAELLGPERLEQRLRVAELGRAGSLGPTRADARDGPEEQASAVILWSELHLLLADLQRHRVQALAADTDGGDTRAFVLWARSQEQVRARWQDGEHLDAILGPRLRVRGAYLWLAARAGLDLPTLNGCLFARRGHWDRRAGDPPWAHDRS